MSSRRADLTAVSLAAIFPTLVTYIYFDALEGHPSQLQQAAYTIGKALQFGFPLFWVLAIQRSWSGPQRDAGSISRGRAVAIGLAFGTLVLVAMLLLYHLWLEPAGYLTAATREVQIKVEQLDLDSRWRFIGAGVFYALCHSFLEEYYWRWFIFGQLRKYTNLQLALGISSLAFMAHHVLLLGTYFGWGSPATYLFSVAVAVGGAVWAWVYDRSHSLTAVWLSHLLIDAAIFIIGYHMVFGG